ncbi:YdhK family protein [Halobacillus shinanisalinarum]|uniref:YdhK family protein n=1 Tax=Halobacillus shinanisalinarum TaxID=2932258 RepID=A0ABY4GW25_9BACI|nr:YdhK family protein [Halobacillus shinanisalinarum]UOQ92103.1 YdhK family protein [Halobacillus shinanisalinarum]
MMRKKMIMGMILLISASLLGACTNEEQGQPENEENKNMESSSDEHKDMNHSSSGEVPNDLKAAENPTYEIGSQVMIKTGHMKGMEGAEATITGAYDTIAYVISYTPTTGGERVENHKWVIHEEIEDAGEEKLEPGTEVTLNASHMKGMNGATAEIESGQQTTVYMISYTPTTGGEKVTDHKWVTKSELSAE